MPVEVRLAKWGAGLGFKLPSSVVVRAGLREGMIVSVELSDDDGIIVKRQRRLTLDELLAGMTSDKEHPPSDDGPRGTETI